LKATPEKWWLVLVRMINFKVLLLLAFTLAFLSFPVHSAGCGSNWLGNDAVGNDPDFNYAAKQSGSAPAATTNLAAERPRIAPDERAHALPASTGANMSMPDPTPKPLVTSVKNNTTVSEPEVIAPTPVETKPKTLSVDGKWSINLENSGGTFLDLILIQTDSMIMGYGTLTEKSSEIPVALSGSMDSNILELDVKSAVPVYESKVNKEYRMTLQMTSQSLAGHYEAYDNNELIGEGNATARKSR
jgi:hypothetical protein